MLKAKVLNEVVEFNDEGNFLTDNEEVFEKLVLKLGDEVDTSQGRVLAGLGGLFETLVLFSLVDDDFEVLSDDADVKLLARLVVEGDVLVD